MNPYESPTAIIKRLGIYLRVAMPSDKAKMKEHLRGLEACGYELAEALADLRRTLHETESRMLHPKDPDIDSLDRRTSLKAAVAPIERDYWFLKELADMRKERIETIRLLLSL